jgi:integrase
LNPECKAFYQLAWHLGAAQSDIAFLESENIDWEHSVINFARKKTGSIALMRFGEEMAALLRLLPDSGPLFPYLWIVRAGDRATEFHQRCVGLKIKGVTFHSYRYAWAERAKTAGYPERFAQEALGHNSKPCIAPTRARPRWNCPRSANTNDNVQRSLAEQRRLSRCHKSSTLEQEETHEHAPCHPA